MLPNVVSQDSRSDVGWIAAKVKPWEYDPDKAKQLLDEAGWPLDGDVRVAKGANVAEDGTKFEFVCNGYTNFKPNELAQLAIQEDLAKVGLKMKVENQDFAIIFGTWEDKAPRMTGDWDTFYYDSGFFIEPMTRFEAACVGPDPECRESVWSRTSGVGIARMWTGGSRKQARHPTGKSAARRTRRLPTPCVRTSSISRSQLHRG